MNEMTSWAAIHGQTVIIVTGFAIGIAVMVQYRWRTRNQKHVMVEMWELKD